MMMWKARGRGEELSIQEKLYHTLFSLFHSNSKEKGKDRISDLMWISGLDTQMSYKD